MTWAEIIQVAASSVGVVISLWLLVDALRDRSQLLASGLNGTLLLVASSNVRQECLRLTVQILLLINAALSIPLPSLNEWIAMQEQGGIRLTIRPEWFWLADIRRYCLSLAAVVLLIKSASERIDRNAIIRSARSRDVAIP